VLYERAGLWEKAAAIYIQIKAFAQAARIMGQVTLPKLHSQYAKVRLWHCKRLFCAKEGLPFSHLFHPSV
jgi:hypothetical protein